MVRTGGSACPPSPAVPSRFRRLAQFLSVVGHPFVVVPLTILASTRNWVWPAVIAASTTLPMLAVIARKVRRGDWSDHDVSRPEQRSGLYRIAFPLMLVAAILLYFLEAPPGMLRGVAAGTAMLATGFLTSRWLKTSMHMMFAVFCAVFIARLWPMAIPALVVFLVALGWSRRVLDRHTLVEILVGSAVGLAGGVFASW